MFHMTSSRATLTWWIVTLPLVLFLIIGCGAADADATTTPSSGEETLLTVEDAQARLAFELILPARVPAGLDLAGVIVGDNPESGATPATDPNRFATLVFSTSSPGERVLVGQTTYPSSVPDAQMNQDQALKFSDRQPDEPLPTPEQGPIMIDGHEVLRTKIHVPGDDDEPIPIMTYSWDAGDVHIDVSAPLRGDVTEDVVVALVEALLGDD